jgi:transposase
MPHKSRRPPTPRTSPSVLERINPDAAGIDCGAAEHYVAVPPDRDPHPVQAFQTFTADLHRLADWLVACGVRTVAMEATGVYWIPLFEILEARGLTVLLVNARHVKRVSGRKSDVSDCEWLRDLHMVGLLRGSFRPPASIVPLRAYLRHREGRVQHATQCVQRIEKALTQMNLRLDLVVSDTVGVTGLRILRDIVAGQHDPQVLAQHRDPRCRASVREIEAALTGHYRAEHLFAMTQHLAAYDFVHTQLAACDAAIEHAVQALLADLPHPSTALPQARVAARRARGLEPTLDARGLLHQLTGGIDLTQIDGIGSHTALKLVAELGTDMTRWPSPGHFTAWLTLAPQNRVSGGRRLSSRTEPSANRAAAVLRVVAMTLGRGRTALGAFYRRLAARKGKPHAVTATARKLAILVYRVLKGELVYHDPGAEGYNAQQRTRRLRQIRDRAAAFGYDLVQRQTGEIIAAPV